MRFGKTLLIMIAAGGCAMAGEKAASPLERASSEALAKNGTRQNSALSAAIDGTIASRASFRAGVAPIAPNPPASLKRPRPVLK